MKRRIQAEIKKCKYYEIKNSIDASVLPVGTKGSRDVLEGIKDNHREKVTSALTKSMNMSSAYKKYEYDHSICVNMPSDGAFLYGNVAFSILVLSTKK